MSSNFEILLEQLDRFIRRFYLNLLIKGSLLFGAGFLILFLAFTILENFGYFSTTVRFVLFYGFVAFNVFVFFRYVFRPLAGFFKIGKRLKPGDAARILGKHFKHELGDKITNALQLKHYVENDDGRSQLIIAGIEQKSFQALKFPFSKAIDLKQNKRFLPYFIIPSIVVAGILFLSPSFIVEPAHRLARYDTHFEKPAPFSFTIESPLQGFQNENLVLEARSKGTVLPSQAFIRQGNGEFVMTGDNKGLFSYHFKNLQESFDFFIESQGFLFGPYRVQVVQKPTFSHFSVKVENPAYTGLGVQQFNNLGDILVAEGARIHWEFNTRGSGKVQFLVDQQEIENLEVRPGVFQLNLKAQKFFNYQVYAFNNEVGRGDSLNYFVQVKPDAWPQIQIEEQQDSVLLSHIFFRGIIQDDYGFSRLEFRYRITNPRQNRAGGEIEFLAEKLAFDPIIRNQTFYHHFDVNSVNVKPGESLEYFFIVFDNDGVNGPKSAQSRMFSFYVPSQEELMAITRESNQQMKEEISSGISNIQETRKDIEDIRRQMLDSDQLNWQQRDALENLLNKQKEVQESFEKLSETKKMNELRDEQFSEIDERLKEKQEELNKIFEEVVSDEMKDLMEKIREELDKLDREQVFQMLDQMQFEMGNFENMMDRALEFFKQLELERMLQQSIGMLEEAKTKQDEVIEENRDGSGDSEQLTEDQKDINENLESLSDLLNELREKNQQLQRPHQMDDTRSLENSMMQDLNNALEQMSQGQQGGALPNQQSGRQKMDQLSERLQNMQQKMFEQQMAEDSRSLRQILENLIKSSFAQESLLLEVRRINVNDPRYVEMIQEQRKIADDLKMIEDSLVALSKRQMQIGSFVNREIGEINMNLERGIHELINRRRAQGASRQQFVMTHINNLALLLNESLQNMQMQMAGNSSGNPQDGDQNPMNFPGMRQMQEQLNQMLEQLQQGHQPMQGQGTQPMSMSEQLARLAAEQEAIRMQLRKITEEYKRGGENTQALDQLQREMERTELDIVTRNITRQTIQRQQRILTRLLEHEKAQLQREQEERREGTTAKNYQISNPADVFEYNRNRNRELEMLRSLPPELKPFYRSLVETYFLNVY